MRKVQGIKTFKKGMCLKSTYRWHGEPSRTYYYKVTKPKYKGKGAYAEIYKTKINGKIDKYANVNKETFIWDFMTQIGRVNNPSGSGRTVKTEC